MIRRALIIYCDNTKSGKLIGPIRDAQNLKTFLISSVGGEWRDDELCFLRNPNTIEVTSILHSFMKNADYTFTVFSGHGYISVDEDHKQYIELKDKSIPLISLKTNAKRQTVIIDACRGYFSEHNESLTKRFSMIGDIEQFEKAGTRELFNRAILGADAGLSVLYSASYNQTSLDSPSGGAFLFSLLSYSQKWGSLLSQYSHLPLNTAIVRAKKLMYEKFDTIQKPVMNREKRLKYFPLAVKPVYRKSGFLL